MRLRLVVVLCVVLLTGCGTTHNLRTFEDAEKFAADRGYVLSRVQYSPEVQQRMERLEPNKRVYLAGDKQTKVVVETYPSYNDAAEAQAVMDSLCKAMNIKREYVLHGQVTFTMQGDEKLPEALR